MRCKHENADHLMPGEHWHSQDGWGPSVALVEQLRCLDCGAWLSLGPSRDDGPYAAQVAVEVRAAELTGLSDSYLDIRDAMTMGEYWGWHIHASPIESDTAETAERAAGYLARAIATHTEET